MKVNTSQFCAMARSEDWQEWLRSTDLELFQLLDDTLKKRKGCKTTKEAMMKIYKQVYQKGHGEAFETFIGRRYPWMASGGTKRQEKAPSEARRPKTIADLAPKNTHLVFKSYRPNLLTFPQKCIIVDNPSVLQHRVQEFLEDKVGADYIIIDDHAYVEYFHHKYSDVVGKVTAESRDIHCYRMKLAQGEKLG